MDAKRIAEAALFMSPEPLTINELTKVMGVDSYSLSLKIMEDFVKEFNARDSALEVVKTDSGKFMMKLREGYSEKVSHLAVSSDFSKAVLRTLGLIAVKQPVKQSLIVKIIGNKAYDYVNELAEKGFLQAKKEGNTKLLLTTAKFESYFGKQADDIKKLSNQAYQATLQLQ